MNNQQIYLSNEARKKLIRGIEVLAQAVISTLGPNGRNVVYEHPTDGVSSTKDGVTVAKHIKNLSDPVETLGINLIKQAALNTANKAGDGTTTSTLLAYSIVKKGLEILKDRQINATELKKGIDAAVKEVITNLTTKISQDISSEEQLEQIAMISANNDEEIGKLIAEAIKLSGRDGVVHIEDSQTIDTSLQQVEGIQFNRGYKSHYFVTDNNTMTCELKNPKILIINEALRIAKPLIPILEKISQENQELLIIADEIDHEALATLILNKQRGTLKVAAVKAPDFGERKKLILEDIAVITGGVVVSSEKGMKLEQFNTDWFGNANAAVIDNNETVIVGGKGEEESIKQRIEELKSQIKNSKTPFEKEQLQERLSKLAGGMTLIKVGGYTETAIREKKDRIDDALHATKAAVEQGIVPGGGSALLYAREFISDFGFESDSFHLGKNIVYEACGEPFSQILRNAGIYDESIESLKSDILLQGKKEDQPWFGYDIKSSNITNMKERGIIDPTKVTKNALSNAAAVAGLILLTECTIVEEKTEKNDTLSLDPYSMMGM